MKYRFFLFLSFFSVSCFGQVKQDLTLEDTSVLKKFFQILTEESEVGYVLFNKKPVCIHGFYCKDPFKVNTPSHRQSVALREGARVWKQFGSKNADIIIHICDKEDPFIPGYIHVLAINAPLFHRTVNENLSLFQYVLGPATTSQGLLRALLSNSETFHSLLKDDRVLIGEILGFGIQNSLYVSRVENIQDAFRNDIPPFLNCESLIQKYDHEYLPYAPSFGFKSVNEELNDFERKLTVSSEKLIQKNPEFIFGRLKNSEKEKEFILELEVVQDKIQQLLTSSGFLEIILQRFTERTYSIKNNKEFQFLIEKKKINKIVAKGIWESLQDYDFEYLPYFIEGFNKLESPCCKTDRRAWFPNYRREILEGNNNLEIAADCFNQLEKDKKFECITPNKIYYRTIKNGRNETRCNNSFVSLSYSIFSPQGHCLINQANVSVNLKNTISGFANGIQGMRIGETREIFIHPSVAYGFETSLEKCIYLRAIVSLLEIYDHNDFIPSRHSIDLSFLTDKKTQIERDENYKMALVEKGKQIALHLRKCQEIDLMLIKNYLNEFFNNKKFYQTTQQEQDVINQVHWNIYFSSHST